MCRYYDMDGKLVSIFSANELSENVRNTINFYEEENEKLKKELRKTKEEITNDKILEYADEIVQLHNELYYTIARVYSQKELDAYEEFVKKHEKCRKTKITRGCAPIIRQTETGIGTCTELQCHICGEKEDITDTDVL